MCSTGYWRWQNYWYNFLKVVKEVWMQNFVQTGATEHTLEAYHVSPHCLVCMLYSWMCHWELSPQDMSAKPLHPKIIVIHCVIYTMMWHRRPHLVPVIGSVEGETRWLFFFLKKGTSWPATFHVGNDDRNNGYFHSLFGGGPQNDYCVYIILPESRVDAELLWTARQWSPSLMGVGKLSSQPGWGHRWP